MALRLSGTGFFYKLVILALMLMAPLYYAHFENQSLVAACVQPAQSTSSRQKAITATQITIVDANGRRAIELGMASLDSVDEVPAIRFFDKDGNVRLELALANDRSELNRPCLVFRDREHNQVLRLEHSFNSYPLFQMRGRSDSQFTLSLDPEGAVEMTSSVRGKTAPGMTACFGLSSGLAIEITDEKKSSRLSLKVPFDGKPEGRIQDQGGKEISLFSSTD